MDALIVCVIILVVVALCVWIVDRMPMGEAMIKWAISALIILIGALLILRQAGVVHL